MLILHLPIGRLTLVLDRVNTILDLQGVTMKAFLASDGSGSFPGRAGVLCLARPPKNSHGRSILDAIVQIFFGRTLLRMMPLSTTETTFHVPGAQNHRDQPRLGRIIRVELE